MKMLDIEQEALLKDLYNDAVNSYGEGAGLILEEISAFMGFDTLTPLYMVLDSLLNALIREDFHLAKNYTVLKGIEKSYNKWPRAFGNAIFLDSSHLFETLLEMLYRNAVNFVVRNNPSAISQVDKMHKYVQ